MPITTALSDLVDGVRASLHSYWKIRAANAAMIIFSESELWASLSLEFENVPVTAEISAPPSAGFAQLRTEIESYITNGRASTDFFLAIISQFESFLSAALVLRGKSADGTLGQLISRAEAAYGISSSCSESQVVAEIRERRNALIHNHGEADQRYLNAASAASVFASFGHIVIGQKLEIDDVYLANAADGLIAYARKF
ncbi:hypothetical protein CJF40_19035 [Pseudomonas lundensis]|jgi:hypothetical protein|uniref:hypothetical protein n=1 Tax=Pseudomonas lundensis TaxID=86185 RepID=UPI000BA2350D|nr:hypothetical protein [Pseudomonas lundensis]OZY26557.1 hypothetical protein CJF40_19035 [Pseudomonas lundensis]